MRKKEGQINYYSDWLKIFNKIKSTGNFSDFYLDMVVGNLRDVQFSYNNFCKELVNFINFILNYYIKKMNERINFYISQTNLNSIVYSIDYFFLQIKKIKFYECLQFLKKEFKVELTLEIDKTIDNYLKQLENYIYSSSMNNSFFTELLYIIKKNKGMVFNGVLS